MSTDTTHLRPHRDASGADVNWRPWRPTSCATWSSRWLPTRAQAP